MTQLTALRAQHVEALIAELAIQLTAARTQWEKDGVPLDFRYTDTQREIRCAKRVMTRIEKALKAAETQIQHEWNTAANPMLPGFAELVDGVPLKTIIENGETLSPTPVDEHEALPPSRGIGPV